ncbi:hypothetical protein ACOBR2_17320 [Telmatobacter bradus]|uniref:hypothetical protein n=1 Tax=Telmatobacter bradus TaxID=474953 RepID=UPI003B4344A7
MERFIQLNLKSDNDQPVQANLSPPEQEDPSATAKKLNMIANKAAHKGAAHSGRGGSGLFSK